MASNSTGNDSASVLYYQTDLGDGEGTEFQPSWELEAPQQEPATSLPPTRDPIRGANSPWRPERSDGAESSLIGGANSTRISFDLAASRIIDHGRGLTGERFPMSRLRIEGVRMITGERELRLEGDGFRRLCGHVGAPADYVTERLSNELRDTVLEFHLRAGGAGRGGLTDANSRVLHRNGVFVGLGRTDLHTLGGDAVVQAIRDGFEDDARTIEVQNLYIEDEAFRLDIVSPSVSSEVRPGDVIQAGVQVEHSYTGEWATTVMAFVVRLVCSNGMVQRECVGSRRTARTRRLDANRHDAEPLQSEQIRSLVLKTRKGLAEKLEGIQRLAQEAADERQLEQFLRQARLHSRSLMKQLRQAWAIEGNEQTGFGLFNALTRLATHGTELSNRQRAVLARLAGIYTNRHAHLCPNCFSILA